MSNKNPLLRPAARGWTYDLSGPNQTINLLSQPTANSTPPNLLDEALLEVARSSLQVRGLILYLGVAVTLITIAGTALTFLTILNSPRYKIDAFIFVELIILMLGLWIGLAMMRGDILRPRDEPIRFNRLRQKVYVYQLHENWLHLFNRKTWEVRPVAYDWDDLRAEAYSTYVPGTVYATGVTLAVVKPGTNQVIDRFHFAHTHHEGEVNWAMAQLFMQQGPEALPTFARKPRDWNNEVYTFNLARRWAPKVQWPAEMDLESRTAPNAEEAP